MSIAAATTTRRAVIARRLGLAAAMLVLIPILLFGMTVVLPYVREQQVIRELDERFEWSIEPVKPAWVPDYFATRFPYWNRVRGLRMIHHSSEFSESQIEC